MRILRALAAQVTLLLCVVGLPMLLAATIGNPLHGLGSLREGQVTDAVVIDLLAGLAYLCWAQFVLAVLTELATALRHAGTPAARHLPRPGASRASSPANNISPTVSSSRRCCCSPRSPAPACPCACPQSGRLLRCRPSPPRGSSTSRASRRQHQARQPRQHTSSRRLRHGPTSYRRQAALPRTGIWPPHSSAPANTGSRYGISTRAAPKPTAPSWTRPTCCARAGPCCCRRPPKIPATATPTTQPPGSLNPVIVHPGDSFAGLAEADGIPDWPTLWPANEDRAEPNGQHFTNPAFVRPGWTVLLPADPISRPPARAAALQSPPTTPTTATTADAAHQIWPHVRPAESHQHDQPHLAHRIGPDVIEPCPRRHPNNSHRHRSGIGHPAAGPLPVAIARIERATPFRQHRSPRRSVGRDRQPARRALLGGASLRRRRPATSPAPGPGHRLAPAEAARHRTATRQPGRRQRN